MKNTHAKLTADSRGRVELGKHHKNQNFFVSEKKDGSIVLTPAPKLERDWIGDTPEVWVHKNA